MKLFRLIPIAVLILLTVSSACKKKANQTQDDNPPANDQNSGNNGSGQNDLPLTTVEFFPIAYDFGEIEEGNTYATEFKVKNTGAKPLRIISVKPACSCMTATYPQGIDITPGNSGNIRVDFNTTGKEGPQKKTLTVEVNAPQKFHVLNISALVKPKEN